MSKHMLAVGSISWQRNQGNVKQCLKTVAVLGPSQGYWLQIRARATRFQQDAGEDGPAHDARSLPYLEPAPSVERCIGSADPFSLHLRHASIGEEFGSGDKAAVV